MYPCKCRECRMSAICSDCRGIAFVGGADIYTCVFEGSSWVKIKREDRQRIVEERMPIDCPKFEVAPRDMRVRLQEAKEVGITTVFGGGSIQLPKEIREAWDILDGDKILWVKMGLRKYTFRKIGYRPPFKPHYL